MEDTSKSQGKVEAAFAWLRAEARRLANAARFTTDTGLVFYYPVAGGDAYPAFYLRDFVYMYASAPEFFPEAEVRPVLDLVLRSVRADGWAPEKIRANGEVMYRCHGEGDVIDSGPFLVQLVAAYVRATGDEAVARAHLDTLARALFVLPRETETGLIWVDPARPHTAYGFTDTVAKTGRELFCSLLMFEALGTVAEWAARFGRDDWRRKCEDWRTLLRRHLPLLWDDKAGMFLAASRDCRQVDIWGSIYACRVGAVTPDQRRAMVGWLGTNRTLYEYEAHLRHLPLPEFWQRQIHLPHHRFGPGEFQNGPFWSTPSGWYAELLEAETPGAGAAFLYRLVEAFREIGVWECIGPDGYRRIQDNLSSVLLPYGAFKRIWRSANNV
jgi:hypothetical protein